MNKMKIFTLFALLLFIFIGFRTYEQYHDLKNTEQFIVLNESKSLSEFVSAFRQTYQDAFITNHIPIDDKTINLLPVKTITEISKRFSEVMNEDIIIRTVSDRPRNSKNMANNFELAEMKYFKNNHTLLDNFTEKEDAYYYTKPMYIKESCLKCHGKREDTLPSVRKRYTKAYDYKLGDIRGLLNIKIKKRALFNSLYKDFLENLVGTIFLYILFLFIIYIFIQKMRQKEEEYTHQLETDIEEKTYEIEKQKKVLQTQAYYDGLTGLPNRLLFNDRLEHALTHAKRHNKQLALFFIDLDHFKYINDTLGHQVGDKLLIKIAEILKVQLREVDTLSRLGGDEFTIIMEGFQNPEDTSILAEKLHNSFKEAIIIDSHSLYTSCSIGISLYPQDSQDADTLLNYADAAMYKAKEEGRNNTQYYSSGITEIAHERIEMQNNLRYAVKNNEFIIHYQPQIDIKSNKVIGMEALVRWNHPKKGLIYPKEFINIAEDTGIIIELDTWVMKTGMKQIIDWYKKGLHPGILSLNLSMRQLRNDDYVNVLYQTMHELKFNPKWLELEITESQVMQKPKESIIKLQQISQMGIKISIDDFGTGYSSLEYLKRLPVNKIKIDKSFIQGIPQDKEDVAIVKAIIALSKSLELNFIAEGVETEEQRDLLFEYGCETIQGFYYYKPLSPDEIVKILLKDKNVN